MYLTAKNLSVDYGEKRVLDDVSLEMNQGEILAVLGSNGAGKTTLFRTIMNFIKPTEGSVYIDGQDAFNISRKELSKKIAYVPQCHNCTFPYSVLEIVTMGRHCRMSSFSEPRQKDYELALAALKKLGIDQLAKRKFRKLSGGEKQLALIARALVQKPKILVMDEPTASLDFNNSIIVLSEILRLKKEKLSILVTTHSPRQARVFADKVLMIKNGKAYRQGDISILDESDALHDLYNINMDSVDSERIKKYIFKTV